MYFLHDFKLQLNSHKLKGDIGNINLLQNKTEKGLKIKFRSMPSIEYYFKQQY